jgi:CheY-like chemotaxis protein
MRILVVGDDEGERRRIATTLQAGGHAVRIAQDERGVLAALQQEPPQIVFFTMEQPAPGNLDVIRRSYEAVKAPSTHFFLVSNALSEPQAQHAYEAGLDGHLPRTCSSEHLLARIEAVRRHLEPNARKLPPPAAAAQKPGASAVAVQGLPPGSAMKVAGASNHWASGPEKLRDAASKFLTLNATLADAPAPESVTGSACNILLLDAQHQLELRVAVGADNDSARKLAIHLFGPDSEDLAGDVLNEVTNIFMGTLKTGFSAESFAFVSGLPAPVQTEHLLRPPVTFKLQEAFALTFADASLVVHLGLRSKANVMVTPSGLREGMVLAKDVLNARGMLLINGGTRLSLNMVEKLQAVLEPKSQVEVMA